MERLGSLSHTGTCTRLWVIQYEWSERRVVGSRHRSRIRRRMLTRHPSPHSQRPSSVNPPSPTLNRFHEMSPRALSYAYMPSITPLYFSSATLRLSLRVAVSSPPFSEKSPGTTAHFWIFCALLTCHRHQGRHQGRMWREGGVRATRGGKGRAEGGCPAFWEIMREIVRVGMAYGELGAELIEARLEVLGPSAALVV